VPKGHYVVRRPDLQAGCAGADNTRCAPTSLTARVADCIAIARPDYWTKNAMVVAGTAAGLVIHPQSFSRGIIPSVFLTTICSCLVSSSNYALNEALDAPSDFYFTEKRLRPIASGRLTRRSAVVEWAILGAVGLVVAAFAGYRIFGCAVMLWLMGVVYNTPPVRSKEIPIWDVLSEAVNNPIRFGLGWYAVGVLQFPPWALLLGSWSAGAFLLSGKRLAEYRHINDPAIAACYRRSFAWYSTPSLIASMWCYGIGSMLIFGILALQYCPQLVLSTPVFLILIVYTIHTALERDSILQRPEELIVRFGSALWSWSLRCARRASRFMDLSD
jgi:decaprenyl-phosphate phosphoribosyltransferase